MNIHPLFVHFPIALLTLYAVLEIASCFFPSKWKKGDALLHIKTFLVMTGGLALLPTLETGEMASELLLGSALIEKHEAFASITTSIFGLLAAGHALWLLDSHGWLERLEGSHKIVAQIIALVRKVVDIIMHRVLRPVLAALGLVSITITGALGASIVYGPQVDPFVTFIYNLVL